MSKIYKLIKNPNLFFYDYFRKKIGIKKQEYKDRSITADHSKDFSISNFKDFIDDMTDFIYKGKRYIHSKYKFLHLLYMLSLSNYSIRIICDNTNCYIYNENIINLKNLLRALKNTTNCYVEIYKNRIFDCFDVIFSTLNHNFYQSNGSVAKISIEDANKINNDNYSLDIDAVYTYVDSRDEIWGKYWKDCFGESSFDQDRYASHDELKYSLRSINQFMPWVKNIYIVSNCSRPKWLKENSKIRWIDHTSIFPSSTYLPTFNSHAIESCLHRIPRLGEFFIYFNDDVFLNRYVHQSEFFNSAGMSINFCEPYDVAFWTPENLQEIGYQHAAINVQNLIQKDFNYIPRYMMQHTPHAIVKSVLLTIEERYLSVIEETRKHKVRHINDISTISFLYPHYALLSGKSVHRPSKCAIIRENNYKKILRDNHKYNFLCFNSWNDNNIDFCKKSYDFFKLRYRIKPEWEQ